MSTGTPRRFLVAVDDSPAALAAAGAAVDLAQRTGATLRFVHVLQDGELVRSLAGAAPRGPLQERRGRGVASLLEHVAGQARGAGVDADTASLEGDPAQLLLAQARAWQADLLVLGRSDVRGAGRAYVGATTRHVLEFSETPVLVVPRPS